MEGHRAGERMINPKHSSFSNRTRPSRPSRPPTPPVGYGTPPPDPPVHPIKDNKKIQKILALFGCNVLDHKHHIMDCIRQNPANHPAAQREYDLEGLQLNLTDARAEIYKWLKSKIGHDWVQENVMQEREEDYRSEMERRELEFSKYESDLLGWEQMVSSIPQFSLEIMSNLELRQMLDARKKRVEMADKSLKILQRKFSSLETDRAQNADKICILNTKLSKLKSKTDEKLRAQVNESNATIAQLRKALRSNVEQTASTVARVRTQLLRSKASNLDLKNEILCNKNVETSKAAQATKLQSELTNSTVQVGELEKTISTLKSLHETLRVESAASISSLTDEKNLASLQLQMVRNLLEDFRTASVAKSEKILASTVKIEELNVLVKLSSELAVASTSNASKLEKELNQCRANVLELEKKAELSREMTEASSKTIAQLQEKLRAFESKCLDASQEVYISTSNSDADWISVSSPKAESSANIITTKLKRQRVKNRTSGSCLAGLGEHNVKAVKRVRMDKQIPATCPDCSITMKRNSLKRHISNFHTKGLVLLKCSHCPKEFSREDARVAHEKYHIKG